MKRKKLLIGAFSLLSVFALASCGNTEELNDEILALKGENQGLKNTNNDLEEENANVKDELVSVKDENSSLKNENLTLKNENASLKANNILNDSFAVKFTNFVGKSTTQVFSLDEYDNVLDALKSFNDVDVTEYENGAFINSINGYKDPNWATFIYENGSSATSGVSGLEINEGDIFEFRYEFWNTKDSHLGIYDKYDVLVDKAIYNYYLNVLPKKVADVDTFTGSTYWDSMAIYKLLNAKSNNKNIYSAPNLNAEIFSDDFYKNLEELDISGLTGNNLFKYYYASRLYDLDLTNFKEIYKDYLSSLTEYIPYGEYSLPFHSSVAKTLGLESYLAEDITNTQYVASTEFGPDGLAWELTGLSSYYVLPESELNALTIESIEASFSKDVSLASIILPYAASGKNVRLVKNSSDVDLIKYLFDNFYDEKESKFETEKLSNDYSSNQIYAALVAYKVERDTKLETNLFE